MVISEYPPTTILVLALAYLTKPSPFIFIYFVEWNLPLGPFSLQNGSRKQTHLYILFCWVGNKMRVMPCHIHTTCCILRLLQKTLAIYAFLLLVVSAIFYSSTTSYCYFLVVTFFSSGAQHNMNANSHTHTCAILLKMYFAAVLATFLKHAQKVLRRPKRKASWIFHGFV